MQYKLSTIPAAFEHDMKYMLLINNHRFKVVSFSQEREQILSYIEEFSGSEVSGNEPLDYTLRNIMMYCFSSDTEDKDILKNFIYEMSMELGHEEEAEQTLDQLLLDVDMLDFSKLIKFGTRLPYAPSNIESIGDMYKMPISLKTDFQLNNIGVGYLFLDSESIGNDMYAYPKTDEKVVILQTNDSYVSEAMQLNELQIHISNWKGFINSPISNYVIFGAYSVVQAFVFPKDFLDEMIVEEIKKYFSIKPFEEEPSNPLHISKFNGYMNPITLSR